MNKQDLGTLYAFLAFMMLITPFGLLCHWTFRRLQSNLKTSLNYSTFILFSLVGLYIYFALIAFIGSQTDGQLGSVLLMIGYVVIMISSIPIVIIAVFTVFQTVRFFLQRRKDQIKKEK